jgi:hypothetical protein
VTAFLNELAEEWVMVKTSWRSFRNRANLTFGCPDGGEWRSLKLCSNQLVPLFTLNSHVKLDRAECCSPMTDLLESKTGSAAERQLKGFAALPDHYCRSISSYPLVFSANLDEASLVFSLVRIVLALVLGHPL